MNKVNVTKLNIASEFCWLVCCSGGNGSLRHYFSLYQADIGDRGRKKNGIRNVQTNKPALTVNEVGPCSSIIIQINRTPGSL